MKKIIFIFICLITSCLKAQECKTPGFELKEESNQFVNSSSSTLDLNQPNTNTFCIKIKFHFVRNDNGTFFSGSLNPGLNSITNVINSLNSNFNPYGIYISSSGFDYIDNSDIYETNVSSTPSIYNSLSTLSYDSTSFNFYINRFSSSFTSSVGGTKTFLSESTFINDYTTSIHELGHTLGLYHTFHGTNPTSADSQGCYENPDGSNWSTCGDLVQDTPSTACNGYNNCSRDITNFMDYSNLFFNVVSTHFTAGQGTRMRNYIQANHQKRLSYKCNGIVGPSYICSSGNFTFSISTYPYVTVQPTFTWSVSSNLQIMGLNTGSSVTISSLDSNNTGMATLTVVVNGETIAKSILIGAPLITNYSNNNSVLGLYDWVSAGSGNMGLIAPTGIGVTSYYWKISEDVDFSPFCPTTTSTTPKFVGSPPNEPYEFSSNTRQAVVNWGSCTGSYLISCYAFNECGSITYEEKYVDVGSPKNNPCYKNTFSTIVAPNPIIDGKINIMVNKMPQQTPCNWKDTYVFPEFNHKLDVINNHVSLYDFNGNMIYSETYDTDEFVIDNLDLKQGNYVVNLTTNEGGVSQQVIVVE